MSCLVKCSAVSSGLWSSRLSALRCSIACFRASSLSLCLEKGTLAEDEQLDILEIIIAHNHDDYLPTKHYNEPTHFLESLARNFGEMMFIYTFFI